MQFIIGLENLSLTKNDLRRIMQPCVAGVILFERNYESPAQLKALTQSLRTARHDLLISIDHEGGRVQRLRTGFTRLPAPQLILQTFRRNPSKGLAIAEASGLVMGLELQQHGIDLSYAPVLDLDFTMSAVIGDRSFGSLTQEVITLAGAVMRGMHTAGMAAVGKHFPGHGGVRADTHGAIAVDPRPLDYLWQADLMPFQRLIQQGLDAIMPAHVIYSNVDWLPAGFSSIWLQKILRAQLGFQGMIISDDLDMFGANAVGNLPAKLELAKMAGCDLVLLCNNFTHIDEAIEIYHDEEATTASKKLLGKYIHNHIPPHLINQLSQSRAQIEHLNT